jgi:hypothetical protein
MKITPAFITNSSSSSMMGWGLVFKDGEDVDIQDLVDAQFGDDAFWCQCMEDYKNFPTVEVSTDCDAGNTYIYNTQSAKVMYEDADVDDESCLLIFRDFQDKVDPAWEADLRAFCEKWKIPFDRSKLTWFYTRYWC